MVTPAGDFSLTFADSEHATVTFPGGSHDIEHFVYGYADKTDYLLGEWVFTMNGPDADGAPGAGMQWIIFDTRICCEVDGSTLAIGHGDGRNQPANASYDASSDTFYVSIGATDNSSGQPTTVGVAYVLRGDDRVMTGTVGPGTSAPSTTRVAAFRLSY